MKNFIKLLSIGILAAIALAACRKDDKIIVSELVPEFPEYTVPAEATGLVIKFKADNAEGRIGVSTNVDWIDFVNLAKDYVSISLEPNKTGSIRTGTLSFYNESKTLATVNIIQSASIPELNGFYFVSEGQDGKNNAQLGYYNLNSQEFTSNWWQLLNPSVRGELGDVANDIAVTDDYLLVTLNRSNLLEISDRSGKHLRETEVPACRKIATDGVYAYITSWAENGYVAKVELSTGKVLNTCTVGYEPEGIAILGKKMYVVNSCSYHTDFSGNTENNVNASISIIDLDSFTEEDHKGLDVVNAYSDLTLMPDGHSFFINSSGDYVDIAPSSLIFDTESGSVTKKFSFGGTSACSYNGKLYIFETSFSYKTYEWENYNCVYDPASDTLSDFPVSSDAFESYGAPSGLWINPADGSILIADKGNYTSPGFLYIYDNQGKQRAKLTTGVCPGHLAWDWR